ncbi:MAG: PAS domain-containing protein [Comamonadaceae bacterium]|nr:PAS domain-containing protein [Comamonadaceae bacterium]
MFHHGPTAVAITRLADGRILDVNQAFETLVGWTRDEAVGRTSVELGPWMRPADREELIAATQRARRGAALHAGPPRATAVSSTSSSRRCGWRSEASRI